MLDLLRNISFLNKKLDVLKSVSIDRSDYIGPVRIFSSIPFEFVVIWTKRNLIVFSTTCLRSSVWQCVFVFSADSLTAYLPHFLLLRNSTHLNYNVGVSEGRSRFSSSIGVLSKDEGGLVSRCASDEEVFCDLTPEFLALIPRVNVFHWNIRNQIRKPGRPNSKASWRARGVK